MAEPDRDLPVSAELTLEEKIGQRLGVGFDGLEPPPHLIDWLREGRVGAIILFGRNVASPAQVKDLVAACQKAARYPLLVGVDQEGGTVARLREGFTEAPAALTLGSIGIINSFSAIIEVSRVLGTEMRAVGINWTLAPVVDLTHDSRNPSVGTRSFGSHRIVVGHQAGRAAYGFGIGGVLSTAKHFPGLGDTPIDTHEALATIDASLNDLLATDLYAFRQVINARVDSVMVSHVRFPALDPTYPTSLSRALATDLLRGRLGFGGFTCSDCMEMGAIVDHYGAGESAVLATLAGIDVILFSQTRERQERAYAALFDAARSGRIPLDELDQSVERIFAAKRKALKAEQPPLDVIRSPNHLDIMWHAARRGTCLLHADADDFPLRFDGRRIALIEFASYLDTPAIERGETSSFAGLLQREAPQIEAVSLRYQEPDESKLARARTLASEADVLVLATRSAHINDDQLMRAKEMMELARRVVLVCLRAPFDVGVLPDAPTILCTGGDSTPSLEAAVGALLGRFTPRGALPVSIMASP